MGTNSFAQSRNVFISSAKLALKIEKGVNRGSKNVPQRNQDVLNVVIPCANAKEFVRPLDFELCFSNASGKLVKKYIFADKWYRSLKVQDTRKSSTAKIALERLGLEGKITLDVRPRNSFGKAGKAISASFDYCPPPKPVEKALESPKAPKA